ncbi:MAG: amidohydrolase family protein, partial [Hyphomicrobiaceae bacterium]
QYGIHPGAAALARALFGAVRRHRAGDQTRLRGVPLETLVDHCTRQPAKVYGIYPQKGTIAVGCDADIAIWDPSRQVTIMQAMMHGGADYTPYEGFEVTGWPVLTMVRGKVVVEDGKLVGRAGHGTYIERARSPFASPAGRQVTEFAPAGAFKG